MSGAARLYSPELLELAVRLAGYPWKDDMSHYGDARSPSCGSQVPIGLQVDGNSRISRIGLRSRACAVGQAAAAIFADGALWGAVDSIAPAEAELVLWLAGEGDMPNWPGVGALVPALDYPGRHGAILLPWRAAIAALSNAGANR